MILYLFFQWVDFLIFNFGTLISLHFYISYFHSSQTQHLDIFNMSKFGDEQAIELVTIRPITDSNALFTSQNSSSSEANEADDARKKWPSGWRPYAALVSGFLMMAYTW